jgi:hypothetical protein
MATESDIGSAILSWTLQQTYIVLRLLKIGQREFQDVSRPKISVCPCVAGTFMFRSPARLAAISSASLSANPHTLGPFQQLSRHARSKADALPRGISPIFDRNAKRIQKDRAALREGSRTVDYVREEVADRMMERFMVHRRVDVFPTSFDSS